MALRENERRILAEIEHRLSMDDPDLAERLSGFDGRELDPGPGLRLGWKPWVVCGAIAAVVITLLAVLFAVTPGPPPETASSKGTGSAASVIRQHQPAGVLG